MVQSSRTHEEVAVVPTRPANFRLATVFGIALVIRLLVMLLFKTYQFDSEWEYGYEYARIARWILLGEGFSSPYYDTPRPSAIMAPAYVYFITSVFYVCCIYSVASAVVIYVFQSLCAAFTCLVFYYLGAKIFSEQVGLLAAIALALYPPSIFFSVMRVHPGVLIVLLIALVVYYVLKIRETRSFGPSVLCGLLMGVTALVEPTVISFFILCYLWLIFYSTHPKGQTSNHLVIMGLMSFLTVLPWTIRNYIVFGRLVPIKSAFGLNLLEGNNPYGSGVFQYTKGFFSVAERERIHQRKESPEQLKRKEMLSEAERQEIRQLNEVAADKLMYRKAMVFIAAQPLRFLQLTARRIFAFWSPVNPYRVTRYDALRGAVYGAFLVLGVVGIVLARNKRRTTYLILLLFLSYPLSYYVTHVSMYRYRYPVEPFLILLSCYALIESLNKLRAKVRDVSRASTPVLPKAIN